MTLKVTNSMNDWIWIIYGIYGYLFYVQLKIHGLTGTVNLILADTWDRKMPYTIFNATA